MLKINTDVNLQSIQMDISPPIETNNPSDINREKIKKEENMTLLLSSAMERVRSFYLSTRGNALCHG
jgi:hypothetical protein